MVCLAPRAPGDSVRPRRLIGASGQPLNFTVSGRFGLALWVGVRYAYGLARLERGAALAVTDAV